MFHRLRPVRKALIIMYYVDWCRGLVSLVHAFFLVQNLSLHHLDFNNNNKKTLHHHGISLGTGIGFFLAVSWQNPILLRHKQQLIV